MRCRAWHGVVYRRSHNGLLTTLYKSHQDHSIGNSMCGCTVLIVPMIFFSFYESCLGSFIERGKFLRLKAFTGGIFTAKQLCYSLKGRGKLFNHRHKRFVWLVKSELVSWLIEYQKEDLCLHDSNPMLLRMSIGDNDHLLSSGSSVLLPPKLLQKYFATIKH